jgi:hypothetical protein
MQQNTWKVVCLVVLLLFTAHPFFGVIAGPESHVSIPQCRGPGCEIVAVEHPWPEALQSGMPFRLGAYRMSIPPDPLEVQFQPALDLAVIRYKEGTLAIALRRIDEIVATASTKGAEPQSLTGADFPRLVFTITPNDPEPSTLVDKVIWRFAMDSKGAYFKYTEEAYAFVHGQVQAYAAPVKWGRFDHLIFVAMEGREDFLEISTNGITWPVLQSIIGSTK